MWIVTEAEMSFGLFVGRNKQRLKNDTGVLVTSTRVC